ncbi:MAG: DUF2330 domain-containing protein [Sandaracinaceae bacterium]|nr:DUF2330 domain-containing protein [Sandaracinaceae bacterium]
MSASLLEPYAAAGHVFVALRLRSNANTRVIQPVVLRMPTREACLPLRLTAIATVPRLPIVTYFLGRMQATPANYSLVELEPTDPDLWTASRSWRPMLDAAIDELGGQAFARDYAGPTPAISLALPSVNDLAGETDPAELIRALSARGYRAEPRLLELFERYVHPPADRAESPASYYDCLFLGSTDHCGEPALFDPVSLMARIDAEITTPRQEAHDLVHRHRYLTRLYTSIRARDMTVDPVFRLDEGLDDHDNVHHARRVTACSAEYYRREAPEHWEIGALRVPITSGTRADDRAYCARLGAVLASEAPACEGRSSRGGCLCWAGGTAPIQGGLLFAVGLLLGARRLRHGRGARAGRARGSREPGAGCESTWRRS